MAEVRSDRAGYGSTLGLGKDRVARRSQSSSGRPEGIEGCAIAMPRLRVVSGKGPACRVGAGDVILYPLQLISRSLPQRSPRWHDIRRNIPVQATARDDGHGFLVPALPHAFRLAPLNADPAAPSLPQRPPVLGEPQGRPRSSGCGIR
jgi:hypothetical protein